MKFLSFNYKDVESYGVKVKREDAVWDLKKVFAEFGEGDFHPQTLLEGLQQNQTLDFQEQVRKAVVAVKIVVKQMNSKSPLMTLNSYHQLHHQIMLLHSVVITKITQVN